MPFFCICKKNRFSRDVAHVTGGGLSHQTRNLNQTCYDMTKRELKAIHLSLLIVKETRIDVYETLCPQQMLVHKGGKIKNWGGECRNVTPTKSLSQNIRVDVNREVKFL